MKLSELLCAVPHAALSADPELSDVIYDSRRAVAGTVFVCLTGARTDGHSYAASAYANGCRCFVCERSVDLPDDALCVLTSDTRKALASMSAALFGHPLRRMKLIGITGTKGKTTTAYFLYHILKNAGFRVGMIGTNGAEIGGVHYPTANTTPESYELHRMFSMMADCDTDIAVMEVSSQAYKTKRVYGITFDYGVFTNLSEDHIGPGEHESFEEYRFCKEQLFVNSRVSVINADDPAADGMLAAAAGRTVIYSQDKPSDFHASDVSDARRGGRLGAKFTCLDRPFWLTMPGDYNVLNALAALAVSSELGLSLSDISDGLEQAYVPGRFEHVSVPSRPDVTFLIDYAHNGVSLKNVLETVLSFRPKRLICLFGSVGERTQIRRREMGEVAGALCDYCILTSDNPATEEPMAILREIEAALGNCPHVCLPDREEAIRYAVRMARPGDVVVLAGKGHEDYQLIGKNKVPFSEKEILLDAGLSEEATV